MEIIKHDKTIGEGVQKTLCYDTPYTVEELEKWRQEFWGKYKLKQASLFKEYTESKLIRFVAITDHSSASNMHING